MTIEQLRAEIDGIDGKLIKLLQSRFDISVKIGEAKKGTGKAVLDKSREEAIYRKIEGAERHISEIKAVYETIMRESRNIQKNNTAEND